jgi:hypothetical protein
LLQSVDTSDGIEKSGHMPHHTEVADMAGKSEDTRRHARSSKGLKSSVDHVVDSRT